MTCATNLVDNNIYYDVDVLENGVVPPYVMNKVWNNFDIDTTSLAYAPGSHTVYIKVWVLDLDFVISGFTDQSKTYNVVFTCSVNSIASP